MCFFYRLSKLAGRYNRGLTTDVLENCRKYTIAFDGDNCVEKALDFCLKLKGEEGKLKNKIVEYNLQLHAHNRSGFNIHENMNINYNDLYYTVIKTRDKNKDVDFQYENDEND